VTRSEFDRALIDEFGATQGRAILRDVVITELGDITGGEALDRGVAPRVVWRALCQVMDVAATRRYGVGIGQPPQDG